MDSNYSVDLDKTETLEITPGEITAMRVQAPPYSIKRYALPVAGVIGVIILFLSMIPGGTT